ncbi:YqaJ domain-containing protein [Aphis craccivora]|uniref:YqaJ domain-containing protein n=1 Tax=Aphis craccivora TaxID=307492 RepID=A0A6G0XPX7_APHCR|nr:YqaJ domain-containing protein [Aphis craccivora]
MFASKRDNIQKEIIEQYKNVQWNEERRKLLMDSNFGRIISRRPDTGCENIVKSLLYSTQYYRATPDGLLDNDGLVEIKCPYSAANMTPDEVPLSNSRQMRIAQKKICVFAVWTPKGIKTETILFDMQFWEEQMFPKLQTFFYDCLLPEIVDPRYLERSIRNP